MSSEPSENQPKTPAGQLKRISVLSPFSAASPQHRRPSKILRDANDRSKKEKSSYPIYQPHEADPNIEMTMCETTAVEPPLEETDDLEPDLSTHTLTGDDTPGVSDLAEPEPSACEDIEICPHSNEEEADTALPIESTISSMSTASLVAEMEEATTPNDAATDSESTDQMFSISPAGGGPSLADELASADLFTQSPVAATPIEDEKTTVVENEEEKELDEPLMMPAAGGWSLTDELAASDLFVQSPVATASPIEEIDTEEKKSLKETAIGSEEDMEGEPPVMPAGGLSLADELAAADFAAQSPKSASSSTLIEEEESIGETAVPAEEDEELEGPLSKIGSSLTEKKTDERSQEEMSDQGNQSTLEDIISSVMNESAIKEAGEDDEEELSDSTSQGAPFSSIGELCPILEEPTSSSQTPITPRHLRHISETSMLNKTNTISDDSLAEFVSLEKKFEVEADDQTSIVDTYRKMSDNANARVREAEGKLAEAIKELELTKKERDDYQYLHEEEVKKTKREMGAMRQRCHELESELETLLQKQLNETAISNLEAVAEKLDTMTRECQEQVERNEKLSQELQATNARLEELVTSQDEYLKEKKRLEDDLQLRDELLGQAQAENERLQAALESKEKELEETVGEMLKAVAEKDEAATKTGRLEEEIASYKNQLKTAQNAHEEEKMTAENNKRQIVEELQAQLSLREVGIVEAEAEAARLMACWKTAEEEKERLKQLAQVLEEEKKSGEFLQEKERLEAKLTQCEELIGRIQAELDPLKDELNEAVRRRDELEEQVAVEQTRREESEVHKAALEAEIEASKERLEKLQDLMVNLDREKSSQSKWLDELQSDYQRKEELLVEANNETERLTVTLEETERRNVDLMATVADLNAKMIRLEDENTRLSLYAAEIDRYNAQLDEARRQEDLLKQRCHQLEQDASNQKLLLESQLESMKQCMTEGFAKLMDKRNRKEEEPLVASDTTELEEARETIKKHLETIAQLEAEINKEKKNSEKAWKLCDEMDDMEAGFKQRIGELLEEVERLKMKCGEAEQSEGLLQALRPDSVNKLMPGSVNNSTVAVPPSPASSLRPSTPKTPARGAAAEKTFLDNTKVDLTKSPATNASCRQQ